MASARVRRGARSALTLGVAIAATLVAREGHASPEDLLGYGPYSSAMGGTGAASARGFEAAWANPALLSRLREGKLTLG